MRLNLGVFFLCAFLGVLTPGIAVGGGDRMPDTLKLPKPKTKGDVSLEETIARRRSVRAIARRPLSLEQVSQILWCAQGITGKDGVKRASPSAGATYPMEIFIAVGEESVTGLDAGVYRYVPDGHALVRTREGDVRKQVAAAALGQQFLAQAPLDVLIAADFRRTTGRYRERGIRYVHMEVGHIGQNIYLQAESLGLGTVAVGAFEDEKVAEAFGLPRELEALYLMPVGCSR